MGRVATADGASKGRPDGLRPGDSPTRRLNRGAALRSWLLVLNILAAAPSAYAEIACEHQDGVLVMLLRPDRGVCPGRPQQAPAAHPTDLSGEARLCGDSGSSLAFVPEAWLIDGEPLSRDARPGLLTGADGQTRAVALHESVSLGFSGDLGSLRRDVSVGASAAASSQVPGSIDWSGSFSCAADLPARSGDPLAPTLGGFVISRNFQGYGVVRAGRYTPAELLAFGQIDGLQGEMHLGSSCRAGMVGGLRTGQAGSDPSSDRPIGGAYFTADAAVGSLLRYSGTCGLMGTVYEGSVDRLACLVSQRASVGPVSLASAAEVDVSLQDQDPAVSGEAFRLTRWNLQASSPVTSRVSVWAGFDRSKRPDTREERDLAGSDADPLFDRGNWRGWAGSVQQLPWNLSLSQEVALLSDSGTPDLLGTWRVNLSRAGLPGLPGARLTASVQDIGGWDPDGFAGRVSCDFPCCLRALSLRPSLGLRYEEQPERGADFQLTDLALQVEWRLSPRRGGEELSCVAAATYSFGADSELPLLTLALRYRF